MARTFLAVFAVAGLALTPAAPAQYTYYSATAPFGPAPGAGLDMNVGSSFSGLGPQYVTITHGAPVHGPGSFYTYPFMYRSNNPSYFPAYLSPAHSTSHRRVRHAP
jgi:hypothetical protein